MSVRLVTTPWLTKNLAGGGIDTGRLLRWRGRGTDAARWYRTPSRATTPNRPGRPPRLGARRPRIIVAMLLALDIGNTNVTVGLFRDGRARSRRGGRRRTRGRRPTSSSCCSTACSASTAPRSPTSTRSPCASVVPAADRAPSRRSPSGATGRCSSPRPGTVPLAVRVDRPGEVGADRLVNALAAGRLYGTPAVVVDFGTATTLDCVAADGAYVGGAIAPGPRARPRGARGADRQAAADRAARPGPGDRPRHGQRHAGRHDLRLPGARDRPARPRPARAGRRRTAWRPPTSRRS